MYVCMYVCVYMTSSEIVTAALLVYTNMGGCLEGDAYIVVRRGSC